MESTLDVQKPSVIVDLKSSKYIELARNLIKCRSNVDSSEKSSKHQKFENRNNANCEDSGNVVSEPEVAAVASNQEQSPDIYKLHIELLVDTFDYLAFEDLCAIRQTSKLFHEVAGICFKRNYSAFMRVFRVWNTENGKAFDHLISIARVEGIDHCTFKNEFKCFFNRRSEIQQPKTLKLNAYDLATLWLGDMKEILSNIEHLDVDYCRIDRKSCEHLPILFPNLKNLSMQNRKFGSEWIDCKYPKLESFSFSSLLVGEEEFAPFIPFLKMNPTIRKLAIRTNCLWSNRKSIKASKLSLEELSLYMNDTLDHAFFQLLIELSELGFYKRLTLDGCFSLMNATFAELAPMHALVKLHVGPVPYRFVPHFFSNRFALSIFHNLEEFHVDKSSDINDIEATADKLKNLERIGFNRVELNDIIPFIKRSRKLRKIKVRTFVRSGSYIQKTVEKIIYNSLYHTFNTYSLRDEQIVINLALLNAERAKLPNAKRVTIYVKEEVYLATKWAMKETDLDFIQLRRLESFQWESDFNAWKPI